MTQTSTLYAIVGAGGFGREIVLLVRRMMRDVLAQDGVSLVFVDDQVHGPIHGVDVIDMPTFVAHPATSKHFTIAIANSRIREMLADRLLVAGARPFPVVADSASIGETSRLGDGAVCCQFTAITADVRIGRFFHANVHSYVAHDAVIGDFVTFAPGVICNGAVVIEDHAYIGAGAVIRQTTPGRPIVIGRGATVGMGAVVTRSVAPGVTVVGNPARELTRSS